MLIQRDVELSTFSTFMVQARALYFATITKKEDFSELIDSSEWQEVDHYFLGEGSNTLFIGTIEKLLIKNEIKGLEVLEENDSEVILRVGGGELWNDFVIFCIDQHYWGVENLILIPGTVGAAPVQNIGAYGAEVSDTIVGIEYIDTKSGSDGFFENEQCMFGYRDSIFKKYPGDFFITHVHFKLSKKANPKVHYDRVEEVLGSKEHSIENIAESIVSIRDSKLPRIGSLGTVGSFFKNPVVSKEDAQKMLEKYPQMKQFQVEAGVKISAAWLLDYLGYKGKKEKHVGMYEKHAMVVVNYGGATGEEVEHFYQGAISDVYAEFGIILEPEINIVR